MRSTMEIDGFNTRLGIKYIAMNEEYTSDLGPLRRLMPRRMTKPGVHPTMKSKWVNSKEVLADEDWIYPPLTPTLEETRLITGHESWRSLWLHIKESEIVGLNPHVGE